MAVGDDGIKFFSCNECGKQTTRRQDLNVHIQSMHLVSPAVQCQFCLKELKNKNSLKVHISTFHRGLKVQAKN